MRRTAYAAVLAMATLVAGAAQAQSRVGQGWDDSGEDLTTRLNRQPDFSADASRPFGPAIDSRRDPASERGLSPWAATTRDVWIPGDGHADRMTLRTGGSLRRADGAPVPPGPQDAVAYDAETYDLSYVRGWPSTVGYTDSGLEVSFTPHAGVEVGSSGGAAVAGATVRIGPDLERMVPDGQDAFGDRSRWYVYAAGSGRAVGYNFARTRDGDYARSGMSHDSGAFLGDAQLGVAIRRGPMQSSFGLIYREIEPGGLRGIDGVDTDVSEGMVAFQLSIKPE